MLPSGFPRVNRWQHSAARSPSRLFHLANRKRGEHVFKRRVVGGMRVQVGIVHLRPRAEHKGGAQLVDAPAALLYPKAVSTRLEGPPYATRVEEQRSHVDLPDRCCVRCRRFIVDENREWHPLVRDEGLGVSLVARSDGDNLGANLDDLVVVLAQLRGVLSAEQSAEVAQKDEDDRALRPELTQAVVLTVGPAELNLFELSQIHLKHATWGELLPGPSFGWRVVS